MLRKGKKKRAELQLPALHFIVADDWIDKLGYETFGVWLKFHTWVDRTDAQREYDLIPRSLEKCLEKLSVSKSKFYRLIRPLWEYGLIDIVEYEESNRRSQKPKNIIVYEYPFHEVIRKYQPLEKLRDWKTDYDSASKTYGMTGGRPRKIKRKSNYKLIRNYRFKSKTVDGFNNETVDGFKFKTVTVSKIKPNNVSNNSSNVSNPYTNESNLSINNEAISHLDLPDSIKNILSMQRDRLIDYNFNLKDIEMNYKAYKTTLNEYQYAHMLAIAIKEIKEPIHSSTANFLQKSVETYRQYLVSPRVKGNKQTNASVKRDRLPKWLIEEKNKENNESNQSSQPTTVTLEKAEHEKVHKDYEATFDQMLAKLESMKNG